MSERDPQTGKYVGEAVVPQPVPQGVAQTVQPQEGAAQPQQFEIPDDYQVTVKVGGQEKQVPIQEALDGFMMREDYTRKSEENAEYRRVLEAREVAVQQQQGGQGAGGPVQPVSGTWPGPLFHGGQRAPAPDNFAPMYGQPQVAPSYPPSELGEDEAAERRMAERENRMGQMFAQTQGMYQQMDKDRQRQVEEVRQDRLIGALPARLPGFDRTAVEAAIYMMPEQEKDALYRMPQSAAYEVVYGRLQRAGRVAAPQAGTQPPAEPAMQPVPYIQSPTRGTGADIPKPLVEAPKDNNRERAIAWIEQLDNTPGQERRKL